MVERTDLLSFHKSVKLYKQVNTNIKNNNAVNSLLWSQRKFLCATFSGLVMSIIKAANGDGEPILLLTQSLTTS